MTKWQRIKFGTHFAVKEENIKNLNIMENSVEDLAAQLYAELTEKGIRSVENIEVNENYTNVIIITVAKCYGAVCTKAQVKYIKGLCDVLCSNRKANKISSAAASFIISAAKANPSIIFEIQ